MSMKKVSFSLWTLGSRAVCSIANGCIPIASGGGETRQCKNSYNAKDHGERAHSFRSLESHGIGV
jgi:hypothetical protein